MNCSMRFHLFIVLVSMSISSEEIVTHKHIFTCTYTHTQRECIDIPHYCCVIDNWCQICFIGWKPSISKTLTSYGNYAPYNNLGTEWIPCKWLGQLDSRIVGLKSQTMSIRVYLESFQAVGKGPFSIAFFYFQLYYFNDVGIVLFYFILVVHNIHNAW